MLARQHEGQQMSDIERFQRHLRDLEQKHLEAKQRRDKLAAELRALTVRIDEGRGRDGRLISDQGGLNKQLDEVGRLILSLEREIREAKRQLSYAEAQAKTVAMTAAAAENAALPKCKLFEIATPDGRRLRHRANSYAALQRQLLPGYSVTGEVHGAADDNSGGFVASIGQSGPNFMENLLAAYGPSLKRWLAGQA